MVQNATALSENVIGKDLEKAVQLLLQNQLVAIPTETVYGLAGNALSPEAVARIFAVKNRPQFNPLIIHTASFEAAYPYLLQIPPEAKVLAERFMPGPLTMLLPRSLKIPDLVTAGSDFVAVRVPAHPLALELLRALPFPLAAPSANPSGYISPTTAAHVQAQLGGQIPYILDGGACQVGLESTIIGFSGGEIRLLRPGGLPLEALEEAAGKKITYVLKKVGDSLEAPGQIESHYAPSAQVIIGSIPELLLRYAGKNVAVLSFTKTYSGSGLSNSNVFVLAPSGNTEEAARNLFAALRSLDSLKPDLILTEYAPSIGLGPAINDRLRRAAADRTGI